MQIPWLQPLKHQIPQGQAGQTASYWLLQPLTLGRPPAFDDPYALVVLAEEELVVMDLRTDGWPPVQPPYLASLHCSAITCSHHVSNIPLKLWERIIAAGSWQNTQFSTMVGPAPVLAPAPPGSQAPARMSRSHPPGMAY